jgi:UDP-glucose 4-epimerase
MKGKRVLITGGLGFVGSNLAQRCLEAGAEVTLYDCLDPKSGGNMYNVHGFENDLRIIVNDIRSFEGISACIRQQDILFNCAAYTSHPNSMREPLIDIEVNCKGVVNILEAARRFNQELRIVHIGTSTQIGKMLTSPIDETHPEFPVDIYSADKSASEKYVLIYGSAYRMRTTVVRLANVYGPRSNIQNPDFGFMNYFIGLALQGRNLTVFGEGHQIRSVTYVGDAVEALVTAALSDKCDREAIFGVSDDHFTVAQISTAIAEVLGVRVDFVAWPKHREVIEIGDAVISNHKIRSLTGWEAKVSLRDGLAQTRDYYQPCLRKYL